MSTQAKEIKAIDEIQDDIIKDFSSLGDWMDKYQHLIQLGQSLQAESEHLQSEENLIPGCQSDVWITVEKNGGRLHIDADGEAFITKGIISLLLRVFNDQPPEDILAADLYFLGEIGLKEHLSPSRANGLASIVERIRTLADEHSNSVE